MLFSAASWCCRLSVALLSLRCLLGTICKPWAVKPGDSSVTTQSQRPGDNAALFCLFNNACGRLQNHKIAAIATHLALYKHRDAALLISSIASNAWRAIVPAAPGYRRAAPGSSALHPVQLGQALIVPCFIFHFSALMVLAAIIRPWSLHQDDTRHAAAWCFGCWSYISTRFHS